MTNLLADLTLAANAQLNTPHRRPKDQEQTGALQLPERLRVPFDLYAFSSAAFLD